MEKNTTVEILINESIALLEQNQKYLDYKMNNQWLLISLKQDSQFYLEYINKFINHCFEDFIESVEGYFGYRHFWMNRKEITNYFNECVKKELQIMFINTFNYWYNCWYPEHEKNKAQKSPKVHYIYEPVGKECEE